MKQIRIKNCGDKRFLKKDYKIAVVYGGISKERPGSLLSGKTVYSSLKKQGFRNVYLVDSFRKDFLKKILNANVAFLILHGRYGEDGKIQGFLETLKIPYTGSGVLAGAIGMDKYYFKLLIKQAGMLTLPFNVIIPGKTSLKQIDYYANQIGFPLFLKPVSEGCSLGSNVIHSYIQLENNINNFVSQGYDKFLIEKYIKGKALTIGLLEDLGKLRTLPILETISKKEFYDYEAKHDPTLHIYRCPAPLVEAVVKRINNIAKEVYWLLACYGFCRVDFMLDEQSQTPYVLEVNTLPGMSLQSNMATMAKATGISYDQLVLKMLRSAFKRPNYLP